MFHLRNEQRSQERNLKHRGHSSERIHDCRDDTGPHGCSVNSPEGRLCICDLCDLRSSPSHIPGHNGLPRGEVALHSGYIPGDLGTGDSDSHSSYRGPRPGRRRLSTAPRKPHPGESSHPCTAGNLSSGARCRHCSSSHTLCMCWWRSRGSTGGHSSHIDIPQRAGPCLDLGRRYSRPVRHSAHSACCMADKCGCRPDSAQGSRWCCRCQGGTEQDQSHTRSRRRDHCPGRFYRRSDIFYKLHPRRRRIQKGRWGCSGRPAVGAGCSGTSGRCSRCGADQQCSAGTEGGSQHSTPRS